QLPLPIKHTNALLLEFVAPVKFCKAVSLVLPVRYRLGTHLQLVTSASFTYTEAKLLALYAVRRRHDPDPEEHARGEASDAPHLYGDYHCPGGEGGLCRARLPASHAGGDCSARRHVQGDHLSVLQEQRRSLPARGRGVGGDGHYRDGAGR